jgi:hypothetical protein
MQWAGSSESLVSIQLGSEMDIIFTAVKTENIT